LRTNDAPSNVRFTPDKRYVRFTPESGHVQCNCSCLLWAKSGHRTLYSITSSARTNKSEKLRGPLNMLEIGILEIGVLFLRLIPR
jgi:hypothetical protein